MVFLHLSSPRAVMTVFTRTSFSSLLIARGSRSSAAKYSCSPYRESIKGNFQFTAQLHPALRTPKALGTATRPFSGYEDLQAARRSQY